MRFPDIAIESLAYVLPDSAVETSDLEAALDPLYQRIGASPGFVTSLTGVEQRRFWPLGVRPWQMAAEAGERALAASGVDRADIGAVISTSVSRDVLEPSVASSVHGALRMPEGCLNFDLANACLGFLSGMSVAAGLIGAGHLDAALVVAGEGGGEVVEATVDHLLAPVAEAPGHADARLCGGGDGPDVGGAVPRRPPVPRRPLPRRHGQQPFMPR